MARDTRIKCDGCATVLPHGEPWRWVEVREHTQGHLELCSECWRKMLEAIGRTQLPKPGEGDVEP